ncbi:hypothetical protein I9W82_002549 [Candida metapsilosis]|uniref:Uncharacterized protein n=1 Tax=Candida metapsilosis TaxID=273372 RepID=A0A8H8DBQ9_9ASCO|nr:hypothetical protein I9W82_002549 [Candida metapsilosis]
MKFLQLIFFIFLALTSAETTSSSSSSSSTTKKSQTNTSVWVTGTDSNGVTKTTQSIYYQTFKSAYTEAQETASSGSVGLGSLSGSVGHIRTYDRTTISSAGGVAVGVGGAGAGSNFITFNSIFALICLLI